MDTKVDDGLTPRDAVLHRLAEEFGDWKEEYAFLDPDVDVVLPVGTPSKQ